MNIKRAKEEIERTVRAYLAKDALGEYAIPAVRQRPTLLMGPPGNGKTQIPAQAARGWEVAPVASLPGVPLVALSVAPPAPSVWAVVFWVCPVGLLVPVGTVAVPVPLVPFTTPSVLLDTLPPSQPVRSMAVIASTIARIDPFFTKIPPSSSG